MKIVGTFIGINRHKSLDVNDLTNATRDARALWALFSDTFEEMNAQLLIDDKATCEAIKTSVSNTLGPAGIDDVAILCFSGHGTRNHRLNGMDPSSLNWLQNEPKYDVL